MAHTSDIYHPEWLELEKSFGTRPQLSPDPAIGVAMFNDLGEQLATQWPELEQEPVAVDEEIPATDTTPVVPVRIYTPRENPGDLPLIVFFHGGGYVTGNIRTEEPQCRIIAARTPAVVVNVGYPLGPDHNLDTIIQSGVVAVNWAASHSPALTSSTSLLVVGGSAGASLTVQLAYLQTQKPTSFTRPITGLGALFPFCHPAQDTYTGPYSDKHSSYNDKATSVPILTKEIMVNITHPSGPYALRASPTSPFHFPLRAPSLSLFPRTYLVTAEHDPCRDDGRVLALRLRDESEAAVREDYYPGLPHYFHWFPSLSVAREAMERVVLGIRWVAGEGA